MVSIKMRGSTKKAAAMGMQKTQAPIQNGKKEIPGPQWIQVLKWEPASVLVNGLRQGIEDTNGFLQEKDVITMTSCGWPDWEAF